MSTVKTKDKIKFSCSTVTVVIDGHSYEVALYVGSNGSRMDPPDEAVTDIVSCDGVPYSDDDDMEEELWYKVSDAAWAIYIKADQEAANVYATSLQEDERLATEFWATGKGQDHV